MLDHDFHKIQTEYEQETMSGCGCRVSSDKQYKTVFIIKIFRDVKYYIFISTFIKPGLKIKITWRLFYLM